MSKDVRSRGGLEAGAARAPGVVGRGSSSRLPERGRPGADEWARGKVESEREFEQKRRSALAARYGRRQGAVKLVWCFCFGGRGEGMVRIKMAGTDSVLAASM